MILRPVVWGYRLVFSWKTAIMYPIRSGILRGERIRPKTDSKPEAICVPRSLAQRFSHSIRSRAHATRIRGLALLSLQGVTALPGDAEFLKTQRLDSPPSWAGTDRRSLR
jgi:hypothetical protein